MSFRLGLRAMMSSLAQTPERLARIERDLAESRREARLALETNAALRAEAEALRGGLEAMREAVRGAVHEAVHEAMAGARAESGEAVNLLRGQLPVLAANIQALSARQDYAERRLLRQIAATAAGEGRGGAASAAAQLYLDLIEAALTGTLRPDGHSTAIGVLPTQPIYRDVGFDWPATAETMIGRARMRNLRTLVEDALDRGVPGDLIETGVWRGGACIYMRAILEAYGDRARRVFVADSFQGLPPPDAASFPADAGDTHSTFEQLAVSRAEVEENFRRYGLLDERVVFLEGWFKDTLPSAPIERLAVLRLDGDMYESTIQALDALYHKVSPGGFVVVDDYILKPCARAVDDFRARHGITAELQPVDTAAVWWQVPADPGR